jgi:transcriptional regulator with XRE-family HTH domain
MSDLRTYRLAQGLSRERLAAKAGLSARTIYGIEREGRCPNPATRVVLAAVLDCEPDDLARNDHERVASSPVGRVAGRAAVSES